MPNPCVLESKSTEPTELTGPPVPSSFFARSLILIESSGSDFDEKLPLSKAISSASISHIMLRRFLSSLIIFLAALTAAQPVAKVVLLPPVIPLYPTPSVSGILGNISVALRPNISAACIAILGLVPPISELPSSSVTVPSSFNDKVTEDFPPPFIQYPLAIPLPTSLPFFDAGLSLFQCLDFLTASRTSRFPIFGNLGPSPLLVPSLEAFLILNSNGSQPFSLHISSIVTSIAKDT